VGGLVKLVSQSEMEKGFLDYLLHFSWALPSCPEPWGRR